MKFDKTKETYIPEPHLIDIVKFINEILKNDWDKHNELHCEWI